MKKYKRFFEQKESYDYHSLQLDLDINDIDFYGIQDLVSDEDLYLEDHNEGKETDPHITLFYGLKHEEDFSAIKDILHNFGVIEVGLGLIRKFEADNYDVIIIECFSEQLNDIHYYIREHFEHGNTFPEYNPHITLAYVQPNSCDHLLLGEVVEGKKLYFDKIQWSHIDGRKLEINLVEE